MHGACGKTWSDAATLQCGRTQIRPSSCAEREVVRSTLSLCHGVSAHHPCKGNASPSWHTTTIVPAWKYTGGITCAARHWCDTHSQVDSVSKSGGKNGAAARCPWLMSQINEAAIRADRKSLRDENKTKMNKTQRLKTFLFRRLLRIFR
jgi:hypothetical protein